MMQAILTIAAVIAASIIVFSSFCRLRVMTKDSTKESARGAFWGLASVGSLAIFSAVFWGWRPDFMHTLILSSIAWAQVVSRASWSSGKLPEHFRKAGRA